MVNIGSILLTAIIGVVFGIIGGALYTVIKIMKAERKAKKDYQNGKNIFEVKKNPTQKVKKQSSPKSNINPPSNPTPLQQKKESFFSKLFKKKEDLNKEYKEDFKKFQKANKELEKSKKQYEKGKITYQELKEKFEYYQNQDYYKRITEEQYGKK